MLDKIFENYAERVIAFKKYIQAERFEKSQKYKGSYGLIRIDRKLWRLIIDFAKRHLFGDRDSEWDIFQKYGYSLSIRPKEKDVPFIESFIISPESIESDNYKDYDTEVILVWDGGVLKNRSKEIFDEYVWSVEKTYHWLIEKLIPEVVKESKEIIKSKGKNLDEFKKYILEFDIKKKYI